MKIAVLYGGVSSEHKISVQTGMAIAESLSGKFEINLIHLNGHISSILNDLLDVDLVFNALHGGDGENGTIQAYLDLHNIIYTGSGAKASKIAMDKNLTKLIAHSLGMTTPRWLLMRRSDGFDIRVQDDDFSKFGFPIVVKPSEEGSTYGLSIVEKIDDLGSAVNSAFNFSDEVIIEEYISGRELTVGILGDNTLPVVDIRPSHPFYDFDCKYVEGMCEYVVPADLPDSVEKNISMDAIKIHKALGCRHYSRIDFRINDNNEHYFLEINTLPGMTSTSLLPKAANAAGLNFFNLIQTIVNLAKLGEK